MITLTKPQYESGYDMHFVATTLRSDQEDRNWRVFIGVPDKFSYMLSTRQDTFLPLALMLSLVRGEPLDLSVIEVDPLFLRNVKSAIAHHASWRKNLKFNAPVNISEAKENPQIKKEAAAFFSGGIDSLFTLVRHSESRSASIGAVIPCDLSYALHVFHRDHMAAASKIEAESRVLKTAAQNLGIQFVPVLSNIMVFDRVWWDAYVPVGHGAALSTIMHALSNGFGHGIIGSSHSYGTLIPWGSSPITDPLYSSSSLEIIHDGSTYTRVEKTKAISESKAALQSINVCDHMVENEGYVNCSKCQKCLRTMITVDLLNKGSEAACPSFDWSEYTADKFGALLLKNKSEMSFAYEIKDAAYGIRPDIVAAVDQAIRRSRRFAPLSKVENLVKSTQFARSNRKALQKARHGFYKLIGVNR